MLKHNNVAKGNRWAVLLLLLLALVASSRLPLQATHEATEQEESWKLVLERCYLCHYLDRKDYKFAPSLKDLFQRQSGSLLNGKPVNDQNVTAWIAEGSPNMPAFKYTLSPQQIQLIVTFLKEEGAANIPMIRNSR